MPKGNSPSHFNGEADNFFDLDYTQEISQKMRVPKNIRVSGDYSEEDPIWGLTTKENVDMNVPERILVVGKFFLKH